jgi:hypothetical protein
MLSGGELTDAPYNLNEYVIRGFLPDKEMQSEKDSSKVVPSVPYVFISIK